MGADRQELIHPLGRLTSAPDVMPWGTASESYLDCNIQQGLPATEQAALEGLSQWSAPTPGLLCTCMSVQLAHTGARKTGALHALTLKCALRFSPFRDRGSSQPWWKGTPSESPECALWPAHRGKWPRCLSNAVSPQCFPPSPSVPLWSDKESLVCRRGKGMKDRMG